MTRSDAGIIVAGMIVLLCTADTPAAAQTAAVVAPAAVDPAVDRILSRLEQRDVRDLRAKVTWDLTYVIEEDVTRKTGKLWYKKLDPVAKFKVRFDRKIVGGRADTLAEEHLFDGRWYVELNSETKTVSRTEMRHESDTSDPYSITEGSFPVPFGQRRDDIVREFDVNLAPPAQGDPENTDHLVLTPRPGTRTGHSYAKIDFWIVRDGPLAGLPIEVRSDKRDGTGAVNSTIRVSFRDVEVDTGFAESDLQIRTPLGFEEIVERLPEQTGAGTTVVLPAGDAGKP